MKSRVEWIDNAKGIAIICVILGHFGVNDWLSDIIYTFHMPLFFFISGLYLTKNIQYKSFVPFIHKKIIRLLIPYLFFSFLLLLFYRLITFYTDILPNSENINYLNSSLNIFFELKRDTLVRCHLWFLTSLFLSNTLIWLICKYLSRLYQFISVIMISLIAFIYNHYSRHTTVFFIDVTMVACLFVYAGTFFIKYEKKFSNKISLVYFIIYILSSYLNYMILNKSNVDMYYARYGNYVLFILSSFSGLLLVIRLSSLIRFKLLSEIGKNSLVLYCLHFIPLLICLHYVNEWKSLDAFEMFLLKLVCCTLTIFIIQIIKPVLLKYLSWAIGESK